MNPRRWDRVPLVRVCDDPDDIRCGPFGTQLHREDFTKAGIPLWGIKHVNAGFSIPTEEFIEPEKAEDLDVYSLVSGDIVMTRKGTIGNCAVYPANAPKGIMHSDLLRLRVGRKRCLPIFLSSQLHFCPAVSSQLDRISGGAIMQGINVGKLKSLEVLLPPMPVQLEFANTVQQIERLQRKHEDAETGSSNLFNSLVQRAFRGEL